VDQRVAHGGALAGRVAAVEHDQREVPVGHGGPEARGAREVAAGAGRAVDRAGRVPLPVRGVLAELVDRHLVGVREIAAVPVDVRAQRGHQAPGVGPGVEVVVRLRHAAGEHHHAQEDRPLRVLEVSAHQPGHADPGERCREEQAVADVLVQRYLGVQTQLVGGREQGRADEQHSERGPPAGARQRPAPARHLAHPAGPDVAERPHQGHGDRQAAPAGAVAQDLPRGRRTGGAGRGRPARVRPGAQRAAARPGPQHAQGAR
jgi:hypothetical protein